jgi:hypothetical protein
MKAHDYSRRIPMANFMYLFRGTAGNWQQPSPEEMERLTKAWMSWVTERTLRGSQGRHRGLPLVQAGHLAEVVELAKGCPNLESGGAVEVRPIVST